jgi:hypothetical protein
MVGDKEIVLDQSPVAVAQRQHARAIQERVVSIDVVAGFARDDFDFSVAPLKQVVLDSRGGVAHRLPAITNPHRFPAIASQGRTMAKIIMVDQVVIGLVLDLNLHRRRVVRFLRQVPMVHPIFLAGEVDEKLVRARGNCAVGQPAVASGQ